AGDVGQKLTDIAARQAGADAAELAANFRGSVRLHVGQLQLTGRAVQVEKDARLGTPEAVRPRTRSGGLSRGQPEIIRQTDAEQTQPARDDHFAPGYACAQLFRRAENAQHSRRPWKDRHILPARYLTRQTETHAELWGQGPPR